MTITKIVITGGPSAGKTTGLGRIRSAFGKLGYTVLFVPETATELISGGRGSVDLRLQSGLSEVPDAAAAGKGAPV